MTAIAANGTASYTLTANQSVLVTLDPNEKAILEVRRAGVIVASNRIASSQTLGPFMTGDVLTITAFGASIDYSVIDPAPTTYPTAVATDGRYYDANGDLAPRRALAGGGLRKSAAPHTIWFNFGAWGVTPQLDQTGHIRGRLRGGATGKWLAPGLTFNGTNHRMECNDSDSNAPQFSSFVGAPIEGFTAAVLACADLDSLLSQGDMIICWAVISHSAAGLASDGVIGGFGMNADPLGKGCWGFGVKSGAAGKITFVHKPQGASALDTQQLSSGGVTGASNTNTKSAICLEISASRVSGLLEVRSALATLGADGGAGQNSYGIVTPSLTVNSGTAAVGKTITSPLCIGALSDSIPTCFLTPAATISTGAANHLTFGAEFGAAGKVTAAYPTGLYPYINGRWLWLGSVATTPAITPKLYWIVASSLTVATIYSNGPGSAPINFSAGAAVTALTNSANFVNFFAGAMLQVGFERRPLDYGINARVVRDLRAAPREFPACLEA